MKSVLVFAAFAALAFPPLSGSRRASVLEDVVRQALRDARASGFVHVRAVRSDDPSVHVSLPGPNVADDGIDSTVRPLSVAKVFVAAEWLERVVGAVAVDCARSGGHPARAAAWPAQTAPAVVRYLATGTP